MAPYRYATTVTTAQIDVLGHLNNAAYLAIFEAARWDVLRETGVPWSTLISLGVSPVILEINLKFRREVRDGEALIIESTFARTAPRRFVARQKMFDEAGKLRASAELVGTFFDVANRRITDAPPELLAALGLTGPEETPRTALVTLRVADVDVLVNQFRVSGVSVEIGQDEGHGRVAWVVDADGNRLELREPPRSAR